MGKLNNVQRIRPEDFKKEYAGLVEQLGVILNEFMQKTVDMSDGNVNFDNLDQNVIQFDITVDESGNSVGVSQINVGKDTPKGMSVIYSQNLTNSQVYVNSQPFITYVPGAGSLVTIKNISGLPADNKFRLTAIVY